MKQTVAMKANTAGRVETGLKAGNFVCFIPGKNGGFINFRVNNNQFMATLMLLGFGIIITVKHSLENKQVSLAEQLIQQIPAVVMLALQREYSRSRSNFSSEIA